MSADKHDRHSAFVSFDQSLEKFHKGHLILFALVALTVGLVAFGVLELIESVFRWVLR
jgi:uncharacterized membrane protein (DUF2068 family)